MCPVCVMTQEQIERVRNQRIPPPAVPLPLTGEFPEDDPVEEDEPDEDA